MSGLSKGQAEVAHILFDQREAAGFALAGGSALLAMGAIDRPTRDIDAFVGARPEVPPGDVAPLVAALRAGLAEEGWSVTVERELGTFARLVVERAGESVEIDLAVDSAPLFPLEEVDGLPILSGQDLAARKVLAILDRAEGRDFTDLKALADRFSKAECIRWACELDAGIRPSHVAEASAKLARLGDADLPCPPDSVPELRQWFAEWARDLEVDRSGRDTSRPEDH